MRIRDFEYKRPSSTEEALSLLGDHGTDAKIAAGGTDLLVLMKKKMVCPRMVIDLSAVSELRFVKEMEDGLHVGPMATLSDLLDFPPLERNYGVLKEVVSEIGSWQVRNRATLAGNLCNASPAADSAPALLVLEAKLRLRSLASERVVDLSDFFQGPGKTLLAPTEMVDEIIIPRPLPPCYGRYLRFSRRRKVDLALVGVALLLFPGDRNGFTREARVALGAVAPIPLRSRKAEQTISGKILDPSLFHEVARICIEDTTCISDIRASREYREEILMTLVKRGLSEIGAEIRGEIRALTE